MPVVTTPKSFTYETSLEDSLLASEGKPVLRIGSPPEFGGERGVWTPEDLFVAAVETCLKLTFAGIARKRSLRFVSWSSTAKGFLDWDQQSYRFTRVVISPAIELFDQESVSLAREVIERAHKTCLVANSLSCEVIVEPAFTVMP
jgi:organic hydroperoxide reductase OsmC/OhrA